MEMDNCNKILNKKTTELTNTKESKIPSENSLLCWKRIWVQKNA